MILLYLLIFSFLVLSFQSLLLFRNALYFSPIHDQINDVHENEDDIKVSICIPARNEAINIGDCVHSCLHQNYAKIEIIVLDDESEDETPHILSELKNLYPALQIINGEKKPDDWLGKNWACHQLSKKSTGDILVFIDADVTLEPHMIDVMVTKMKAEQEIGLLSIWPEQKLVTFWENVLIPMVYYSLLHFLYLRYTEIPPRWIPKFVRKKVAPVFSAACGQFMAFRKEVYSKIDGHSSVKSEVVEDVELAKKVIENGFKVHNSSGKDSVYCRMYRSYEEIKNGFRKNFFAGFRYNYILFLLSAIFHLIVYILPIILLLFYSLNSFWPGVILAYCTILFVLFQRLWLSHHFNWSLSHIFTHPLGVLWFQYLSWICMIDRISGRASTWKGRKV